MSDEIKLRCDYAMPASYQPQYDEQGRFKIPWGTASSCGCPKANSADEDAWIESMMPTDEEAGMRKVVPDPFQEAGNLALAEALVEDLAEQVHRVATDADRKEEEELRAMGMPSFEEIMATVRGRR